MTKGSFIMLNKVQLIGFLGGDPKVCRTPEQETVARVRLATNETWKKNGERHEKTEWHSVVFFGKFGEVVGENLKKGALVYVEGRLQTYCSWGKEGYPRYITEIVAETMKRLPDGKMKVESDAVEGAARSRSLREGERSENRSTLTNGGA